MVALLVVGLMVAVVYPRLAGLERRGIDAVAGSLVHELRRTRLEVLRTGQAREVDAQALRAKIPRHMLLEMVEEGPIILLPTGATSGGSLVLRGGGAERRIDVDWLTGRIGLVDG